MQTFTKVGLEALLTPENCVLLLIDHQPSQLANVNSHDPTLVINNVTALAKTAKAYGVPTILTTISAKRGGEIFKQIQIEEVNSLRSSSVQHEPRKRTKERTITSRQS
jgi:nicotinamidase-related amidase